MFVAPLQLGMGPIPLAKNFGKLKAFKIYFESEQNLNVLLEDLVQNILLRLACSKSLLY